MKKYLMEIKPALKVTERHRLEDCIEKLGYHVSGGGQGESSCDISFYEEPGPEKDKFNPSCGPLISRPATAETITRQRVPGRLD